MKVLFLHDSFPPQSFGGGGISVHELAVSLKNAGHDASVITTCRKESDAGEFDYQGVKVFRIASNYHERWRAYRGLYNRPVVRKVEDIIRRMKPDVVHVSNVHYHLSYHCLRIAKRHAKAVVFTARDVMTFNYTKLETKRYLENFDCHTTWLDHLQQARKRWNPLRNFFIRRYLKYADKKIAISKALQKALAQNGINNVDVIYNGINAEEWRVDQDVVAGFQAKHNLFNKKVLLFGGRLSAAKGAEKVLEALVRVVKEDPGAMLLIMGKIDWYAEVMKQKAKELGVEKHLIFTGWIERDEIKAAYAASDVVLMPSICFDSFGRVNIEAMASQKPVIGTCYGGTPEIVVDGVTGYIVNPLYPEEIAEKTLDLLKNPKKAEKFGQAGYERVRKYFNLDDKVKEYIAIYKVLGGKK